MTNSSTTARPKVTIDGNEAAAYVAHQINEVIAIYPITPSSNMGEWADQWSAEQKPNIWGTVPTVIEMQSEGGAAGALHGALQAGSLATTFTASQGLLLMIPNMFKIAGELTSTVFHIAARALAAQALSIFGDHSDVMAARATGFRHAGLQLGAGSHGHGADRPGRHAWKRAFRSCTSSTASAPRTKSPRSSSSRADDMRAMIDDDLVRAHRARALIPRPARASAARRRIPDVYFQAREAVQPVLPGLPRPSCRTPWTSSPRIVGRQYHLFDYVGAPDAERVHRHDGLGRGSGRTRPWKR